MEIVTLDALGVILGLTREQMMVQKLESATLNETMTVGVQERRLAAIGPYISPSTFDVPPPAPCSTALQKHSEKQVKWDLKQNEKRLMKGRMKAVGRMARAEEKGGRKSDRDYDKGDEEA